MAFKNQAEIYRALLDGKTVGSTAGTKLHLKDGGCCFLNTGTHASVAFDYPKDWFVVEPEPLTLDQVAAVLKRGGVITHSLDQSMRLRLVHGRFELQTLSGQWSPTMVSATYLLETPWYEATP